jgi:DNA-binding NtrC family response regulator
MQKVIRDVERIAPRDVAVLLTGESGTGKELIADLIHTRSGRPRISKISYCSSLEPKELEAAYNDTQEGTLLLRDICEMPTQTQGMLLRLLDRYAGNPATADTRGKLGARLIAVTNCKPQEALKKGMLLEALYYRISAFPLPIQPLRERPDDIRPLAELFLKRFAARDNRAVKGYTPTAVHVLTGFNWPGNMNELERVVQRAVLFCERDMVDADDLDITASKPPPGEHDTSFTVIESVERNAIVQMLKETGGNKLETAKRLGIGRQTLYNKIKAYGIEV